MKSPWTDKLANGKAEKSQKPMQTIQYTNTPNEEVHNTLKRVVDSESFVGD